MQNSGGGGAEGSPLAFGPYEVLERVAAGSTGIVYRARHLELGRIVAIKELSPAVLALPGQLERFRQEAHLLATLDHPHIVAVYDYVEEDGRAWLVQEWVAGASLTSVLTAEGSLSATGAVSPSPSVTALAPVIGGG